jgi:hypothetical protein
VTARIQTEARVYVIFAMKILIHSLVADYVYVLCNQPIVLDLAVDILVEHKTNREGFCQMIAQ